MRNRVNRKNTSGLKKILYPLALLPVMGVGYVAGEQGLLSSLQSGLNGAVAAYAPELTPSQKVEYTDALVPLRGREEEMELYFVRSEKGPRIDRLVIKGKSSTVAYKAPRQVVAAISPYGAGLNEDKDPAKKSTDGKSSGPTPQVVRDAKASPLEFSKVALLRATPQAEEPETEIEETVVSSSQLTNAQVYFENPTYDRQDQFISLAAIDRTIIQTAAIGPTVNAARTPATNAPISGNGRKLYYGALLSAKARAKEKLCLAKGIYFESRGEPVRGQMAVAQVIMNRVRLKYYPNTICGVVFENAHRRNRCQFSFACDGIRDVARNKKLWKLANDLAQKTMDGEIWLTEVGNASHYHADYVRPRWRRYMTKRTKIGVHIFYRGKFLSRHKKRRKVASKRRRRRS